MTKYICPSCKAKAGVEIVYGYPVGKALDMEQRGEIALGGCCVSEIDPERKCTVCGHEWHIRRRNSSGEVNISSR